MTADLSLAEAGSIMENEQSYALIIQPGAIGDCLLTLPLVRMLRQQAGINQLDIMGHEQHLSLLTGRSELRRVISLDSLDLHRLFSDPAIFDLPDEDHLIELFRPYELIITFLADPQGNFERNLIYTCCISHAAEVITLQLRPPDDYPHHSAHFYMQQLCRQDSNLQLTLKKELTEPPFLRPLPEDQPLGLSILNQMGIDSPRQLVAIHPGSGGIHKCWPINNFQKLAASLTDRGYQVIFLLGPAEIERWPTDTIEQLAQKYPLLRDLSLEKLAAVLTCCKAYIGNDSGISHLAAMLSIATITIFGPSQPQHWKPLGQKIKVCRETSNADNPWPDAEQVLSDLILLVKDE